MAGSERLLQGARWLTLAAVTAVSSITLMELLIGLAVLVWLARLAVGPRHAALPNLELTLLFSLLAAWSALGLFRHPRPGEGLEALSSDLMWLAAPLATAVLAGSGWRSMRAIFVMQGGLIGLWAILERLLWWDGDPLLRVRGPYSHHMTLAGVLLLLTLQGLPRPTLEPLLAGRAGRWLGGLAILLAAAGMAATQTRSASLGLACGLALGLVLAGFGGRRLRMAAGLMVVLGVALAVTLPALDSDATGAQAESARDRLQLWEAGGRVVSEAPLWGIGVDRIRVVGGNYLDAEYERPGSFAHLHSAWLTLAAERGLPALALLMVIYGRGFWRGARLLRRADGPDDFTVGAMAALAGFLVMGFFEDGFDDSEVLFVHLMLLAALWRAPEGDDASSATS